MDSIGDWNTVETFTLIIPSGETAKLNFNYKSIFFKFEIIFRNNDENKESHIKIEKEDGYLKLVFTNWNNALGAALTEVSKVATYNNNLDLGLIAVHWKIGDVDRLDVKFLVKAHQND